MMPQFARLKNSDTQVAEVDNYLQNDPWRTLYWILCSLWRGCVERFYPIFMAVSNNWIYYMLYKADE